MPPKSNGDLDRQITAWRPRLGAFIRRRVDRHEDAQDILQDVLTQWVRTAATAADPIENLSAWLHRVARNRIVNFSLKKREEALSAHFEPAAADSPEAEYLRSLVWSALERALEELPPAQRSIFELTELEGIPVKEIAEASGVPVATLLTRKHYAVLHLRKRLQGLYNELIYS